MFSILPPPQKNLLIILWSVPRSSNQLENYYLAIVTTLPLIFYKITIDTNNRHLCSFSTIKLYFFPLIARLKMIIIILAVYTLGYTINIIL